jgi:hypothetical protein
MVHYLLDYYGFANAVAGNVGGKRVVPDATFKVLQMLMP